MGSVLLKVASFVTIILIGIFAARSGTLGKGADKFVSKVVFNLTLPAAVIHALGAAEFSFAYLMAVPLGFVCAALPYVVTFIVQRKRPREDRVLGLFCSGGMNIGCFALPFVQAVFPPAGAVVTCMFDAGNSIVVTGGSYALTSTLLADQRDPHLVRTMLKRLFSSAAFDCYVVLIVLALAGVAIPDAVIQFTEPIANANIFLSLFMLGLMTSLNVNVSKMGKVLRLFAWRTVLTAVLCALILLVLPLDPTVRTVAATLVWAPCSAMGPLFTLRCGGDYGLAALTATLSIAEGVVMMVAVMALTGVLG